jgi:flagellar motility protein MotE (MotC chaperone)
MQDNDPFTKSQKEVLDRMDRWKKKTEEKLLEEEDKLADRIHSDHTGPGVPKFVGKYTHGVKQHEQRLKRVIDKLRDDEEAEVKEEMDDQESECSRCGKDPCVCGMEKSSRGRNHGKKKR